MLGTSNERLLIFLLRLGAVLTGSAIFAVFLPAETMAAIHERLGLGDFPDTALTSYLTRSLSAMYAFHGALLFILSTDVRRYRTAIIFLGWSTAALGAAMLGIDLHAPMPLWWTLAEGPWVIAIGAFLATLARRLEPSSRATRRP